MEELKKKYNHLLKRFENGCIYVGKHKNELPKYMPEIFKIVNDLSLIIDILAERYNHPMTDDEIERGFNDC